MFLSKPCGSAMPPIAILIAIVVWSVNAPSCVQAASDKFGEHVLLNRIDDPIKGTTSCEIRLFNDSFLLALEQATSNIDQHRVFVESPHFMYLLANGMESFVLNGAFESELAPAYVELRFDTDPKGVFHKLEFESVGNSRSMLFRFDGKPCIDLAAGKALDSYREATELIKGKCKSSSFMYFSVNNVGPYTTRLNGFTKAYETASH